MSYHASLLLNAVFALLFIAGIWLILRDKEDRKLRGVLRPWPIRQVDPDAFDARFRTDRLGPSRDTEIRSISHFRVKGGISDFETWILCCLSKTSKDIFEFGTCTGKTTYLFAANAPAEARVVTITLSPGTLAEYRAESGDTAGAMADAVGESAFEAFYYTGTPEAAKITQLFGDSKAFDEGPHREAYDLVFVDGSHARSYVESDSRKAMAMLRPGGFLLWHDYRGPRKVPGVYQALNELGRELALVHIKGTSLVAWRKPA